jgi:predicted DCC family thiol-disulfide oxidoreductase YuxK
MSEESKVTVYYNSACPVCHAGIEAQQNRMGACELSWIDVHNNPESVRDMDANLEFVKERLHVVDERGRVSVGVDALAALWLRTPTQHWIGRVSQWPGVRGLSQLFYNAFARLLYRWNRWAKHW